MPRIHTITTDTVLSDNDMLLGTDGAVGANNATKNFSFGVFKNYITSNVTFTGDTIISGGNLTLDNNEFLMSKMANGTAASLIGISSNNQIKLSNSNLPIYTGTGLTSLGGNLELPNGNIIANGTLAASGYNDSNWNTAYSWGNHATAGYLPLTGGTITGNMINRGEQSFGVDGDGELFKIYTNTAGKLISFNPASNGKLNFTDNTAAMFGNSDDLQIYHNGTANYIDSNGGQMFLRASVSDGKMYFMGDDGNGGYAEYFYLDGAAAVYDGSQGQAVSVETRFPQDAKVTFGITGSMQTSLWNSSAGNFFMSETGGGNMNFHTDGAHIAFGKRGAGATHTAPLTDAETMAKFIIDGAVELYHDNSKKLETTSFGIQTTGSLNIHGAYQFPITDGTNGQVLKTNGSGVLAFADDLGNIPFINGGTDFTDGLIVGHNTHVGTLDAAQRNIGVGNTVLQDLTQGDDNTVMGHSAGAGITTGSDNVLIGSTAGVAVTTANDIIAIGKNAADSHDTGGTGDIAIGTSALAMGHASSNTAGRTAIGFEAGTRNQSSYNTFVGWKAGATQAGLDGSGSFHDEVLHSNSNSRCVVIGANAGTSTNSTLDNEIVIGFGAKGKGANTVVIGNNATTSWLPHDNNGVDLGSATLAFKDAHIDGSLTLGGAFTFPTAIGTAGQILKVPASGSTLEWAADMPQFIQEGGQFTNSLIIGHVTTGTLDQALGNTGVGVGAMNAVTSGDHNAALGHDALGAITIGSSNIAIGKQALFTSVVDSNNVAIGKDALYSLTNSNTSSPVSGQAENNIAIGWQAGNGITTGSNNIVIGYNADASSATVNNEITIGNTDTTHAIIKGLKKEVSNITSNAQASRNNIHVFSASSNLTITLPDTGTDSSVIGMSFTFVTKTAPAAGNVHKIVCSDTTNESIFGSMLATKASSAGSDFMQTDDAAIADGRSSINFNGTTQGGRQGTHITLTCIAADTWLVEGTMRYTGTFASSFANS